MRETKDEIEEDVVDMLKRNGPMRFTVIAKSLEYEPNNTLYALTYSSKFVLDDSWRFHLTDEFEG